MTTAINSLLDDDNAASFSSSSSNLTIRSHTQTSLPPLLDGTFFECVEQKDNKIRAKCLKCLPKEKGVTNSNANFIKHLKKQHESAYEEHTRRQKIIPKYLNHNVNLYQKLHN